MDGGVNHTGTRAARYRARRTSSRDCLQIATADQFPIWDHIGGVDGSVSVAFKTVDLDRVAGIVWRSVETKKQIA